MTMTTNILLIILFAVIFIFLISMFARRNAGNSEIDEYDYTNVDEMIKYLKERLITVTSPDDGTDYLLSLDEITRRKNIKTDLRLKLKDCTYGDIAAKNYIKSYFEKLLVEKYGGFTAGGFAADGRDGKKSYGWVEYIIPFDDVNRLTAADKFDIILYKYKQKFNYDALKHLIEKYELNKPKISEDGDEYYAISAADIKKVFAAERITLEIEDKLHIIVQRVYQQFKGHGVIDEIRDMNIDGVSGGVNGVPESFAAGMINNARAVKTANGANYEPPPANYDSVWIMYAGINYHLSFLSFGSNAELIRVCENLYRYGNPGQLTKNTGKIINRMKDGSRITVARPDFSESWVFLLRKFSSSYRSLDELYAEN